MTGAAEVLSLTYAIQLLKLYLVETKAAVHPSLPGRRRDPSTVASLESPSDTDVE